MQRMGAMTKLEEKRIVAQRVAHDVLERIDGIRALSLGYLSLDRSTPTLSAGELQRLRLATQIRSNLFGVVYVMDEPSAACTPPMEKRCSAPSKISPAAATRCSLSRDRKSVRVGKE